MPGSHYELCIVHYALCIVHYALCIVHCALANDNLLSVVDVDAGGQVVAVHLLAHQVVVVVVTLHIAIDGLDRSEEHTSELQSR